MFNVAVLRLKDVLKVLGGIIFTICFVAVLSKTLKIEKSKEGEIVKKVEKGFSNISQKNLINCLESTMPVVSNINKEYKQNEKENKETKEKGILQMMLASQIPLVKSVEEKEIAKTEENKRK